MINLLRTPLLLLGLASTLVLAACGRAPDPAENLVLSDTELTLEVGETATLEASLIHRSGSKSDATVTWLSSNPAVASVSDAGVVSALAEGSATVTATHAATALSATAQIIVEEPDDAEEPDDPEEPQITVTIAPRSLQLLVGATGSLTATVEGSDDGGVNWSVNPESQAIVELEEKSDQAELTALAVGTVEVTATSTADPSKSDTATVEVVTVLVELDTQELDLVRTQSVDVTATVDGIAGHNPDVTWATTDGEVASIDANGNVATVTAAGVGQATITATSAGDPGVSAALTVNVTAIGIAVEAPVEHVFPGESIEFTATLSNLFPGANSDIEWTLTPEGVLTLDPTGIIPWESGDTKTFRAATAGEAELALQSVQDPAVRTTVSVVVGAVPLFDPSNVYVGGPIIYASAEPGTLENPFETIREALDSELLDDATINVAAGAYSEEQVIALSSHQLVGAGSGTTEITVSDACAGISVAGDGALITGLSLDVAGLDTDADCDWVRGIYAQANIQHLEISDIEVVGALDSDPAKHLAGIQLYSTQDTLVSNVTVRNTQRSGIEVAGGSNVTLRDITVVNAGQGEMVAGLPFNPSGFGALGVYANAGAGNLDGLTLDGQFSLSGLAGQAAMIVHPSDDTYGVNIELGAGFNWDSGDALTPIVVNISDIEDISQLSVESGFGDFLQALGISHIAWAELGFAEIFAGFTSEAEIVGVTRTFFNLLAAEGGFPGPGPLPLLLIELDLDETHADVVVPRNVVVVSSDDNTVAHSIQFAIDFVLDDGRFTEGVYITPGIYSEQVFVDRSISLTGAGKEDTFLSAAALTDWDNRLNRIHALLYVHGEDTDVSLSGITVQGPLPGGGVHSGPSIDTDGNHTTIAAAISVGNGATLNMANANIRDTTVTSGSGVPYYANAISAGHWRLPEIIGGTVNLTDVDMSNTARYAIVVSGEAAALNYHGGSVRSEHTTTGQARLGIGIYEGAHAEITGIEMSGLQWDQGSATETTGIWIDTDAPVRVTGNTFTGNDRSLTLAGLGAEFTFSGNTFEADLSHTKNVFVFHGATDDVETAFDTILEENTFMNETEVVGTKLQLKLD